MTEHGYGNVVCDLADIPGAYKLTPDSLRARTARALSRGDPRAFLNDQDDTVDEALAAVVQAVHVLKTRMARSGATAAARTDALRLLERIGNGSEVNASEIAAFSERAIETAGTAGSQVAANAAALLRNDLVAYVHARQLHVAVAREMAKRTAP